MSLKTYEDCAKCSHLTLCTAHITGGSHPHNKGVDPCVIVNIGHKSKPVCECKEIAKDGNICHSNDECRFQMFGGFDDPVFCMEAEILDMEREREKSSETAIPPPPSTMPRKGEEPEPGYAQRFSLREEK
jgi:hypothetical protein